MKFLRLIAIVILPSLLSGCLFIPGKFESVMDMRRNGNFTFAYKGELVFQLPDEKMFNDKVDSKPKLWNDKMAVCWSDDTKEVDNFGVYEEEPAPIKLGKKGKAKARKFSLASFAEGEAKAAPVPPVMNPTKPMPVPPAPPKPATSTTDAPGTATGAANVPGKAAEAAKEAASKVGEPAEATDAAEDAEASVSAPIIRKCAKAEIAELKTEWQEKQDKEVADAKQFSEIMASVIGLDPTRPDTMNRFAADLMKQAGWRSVVYKGDGIFLVDYLHTGNLDQDFIFPVLPDQQYPVPFVMIKRRADGSALVETPGYALGTNGGLIGAMIAVAESRTKLSPFEKEPRNPLNNINGKFTLTTDGEILTNNTVDGPTTAANGRTLFWEFNDLKDPAPKALIKLK
jgi:hypothetical protein